MLDIRLIRENPRLVEENLLRRGDKEKIKLLYELLKLDGDRRKTIQSVEALKRSRNEITKEISQLKSRGKKAAEKMKEAKELPSRIRKLDEKLGAIEKKANAILMNLPNLLHESVPRGAGEADNAEIRRWGQQPKFHFQPKGHMEILQALGMVDFERGAKVAGAGFYYLKGDAVMLDMALQRFAIDALRKNGFTVVAPPLMINRKAYEGMIDPADFEMVTYKIENESLYLIATAEHPLGAQFMEETFNKDDLPIKLCGISPCFRKEIGTHGKYTKGIFRVHHFNKSEQFVFCLPEQSWQIFEELQNNVEAILQQLEIPYRVVANCTGDIGSIAAKKYDTEFLMADGKYREIGSNSNCTDYQARSLNIKYREREGLPPAGFVHTLNSTALSGNRPMIAVIENNQREDGTVEIPKALQHYTGFKRLERG